MNFEFGAVYCAAFYFYYLISTDNNHKKKLCLKRNGLIFNMLHIKHISYFSFR